MMIWQDWFMLWGFRRNLKPAHEGLVKHQTDNEEMYQTFKARLIAELDVYVEIHGDSFIGELIDNPEG